MLFPFHAPPAIKNNEEAALNVLFSVFEMKGMRQISLIWQSDSYKNFVNQGLQQTAIP